MYHETNGDKDHCLVRAPGRRYLHLRHHGAMAKTFLSVYYMKSMQRANVNNLDVSMALKRVATVLTYPTTAKEIPNAQIDTHLFPSQRLHSHPCHDAIHIHLVLHQKSVM